MVEQTVKVQKRVEVPITISTGTGTITPADLAAGIPGGATYWSAMRIDRIDIWGEATSDGGLTVRLDSQSGWSQPNFTMRDSGTTGHQRPACGFRLGLLDRARFFGTADTTPLCTVSVATMEAYNCVVQASIELVSGAYTS